MLRNDAWDDSLDGLVSIDLSRVHQSSACRPHADRDADEKPAPASLPREEDRAADADDGDYAPVLPRRDFLRGGLIGRTSEERHVMSVRLGCAVFRSAP